jgi:hypothetical protein
MTNSIASIKSRLTNIAQKEKQRATSFCERPCCIYARIRGKRKTACTMERLFKKDE